jgi:endonuclease/exonuclease/phosphatase family metal-dependent hydrolase
MNHPTLNLRADISRAATAAAELLEEPTVACREALRARVIKEMTPALIVAGDTNTAPDSVRYALTTGHTDTQPRS